MNFGAELPERGDGGVTLGAQPLAELGLVGKLVHAGQWADQRFVVEALGVGQAGPAGAEAIAELGDDEFGAVAVGGAGARVQAGQGAQFGPEIELLGQRLEGGQPTEDGLFTGGDKLEAQLGRTFANQRHETWTAPATGHSKGAQKMTAPAGARRKAKAKEPLNKAEYSKLRWW
jgi:hypothetical protein